MPKLEDLQKLKDLVDSLGEEKEIRQAKGEEFEEIEPPSEGLSGDLKDLLGIIETTTDELSKDGETAGDDIASPDIVSAEELEQGFSPIVDESDFLKDIAEKDFTAEGFSTDLDVDAGKEVGLVSEDKADFEAPTEESILGPEGTALGEAGAEGDSFNISDFNLADLDQTGFEETKDLAGAQLSGSEAAGEEGASEPPGEASFDLADFNIPDFQDESLTSQETKEQPGISPGEQIEENLFDVEGFAEESLGGEAPTEAVETKAQEVADEFAVPPDLSDFGISEEMAKPDGGQEPGLTAAEAKQQAEEETISEQGLEGLDDFKLEQFSLPEESLAFGMPEETPSFEEVSPTAKIAREEGIEYGELAEAEDEIQYSPAQFELIKATLNTLPLNLKLLIEELIGEKGLSGERLKRLLDALATGQSPRVIADLVGNITGQKIQLPKSFEKRTGLAYEKEKDTLAYFLRTKGKKALAVLCLACAGLVALVFLLERLVFPFLRATPIYDEGYQALMQDRYEEANRKFKEASSIWDSKDQYYRFAEGFIERGNYFYAHKKYSELLTRYPDDTKGLIDYARLQTLRGEYRHSEKLMVDNLLMRDVHNYEGNLAAAENYLAWAEEDLSKLKDADFYFNFLVKDNPQKMDAHLKRISYLIRSEYLSRQAGDLAQDNEASLLRYVAYLKNSEYREADPFIYTQLAEYLIDKRELTDVRDILLKALDKNSRLAEAWYEFARFARLDGDKKAEFKALSNALNLFEAKPEAKKGRDYLLPQEAVAAANKTAKHILTLNRLGEYYYLGSLEEGNKNAPAALPQAEEKLMQAQRLFEQNRVQLLKSRFGRDGAFGKIYYNLGNLAFASANWLKALDFFLQAERNGFKDVDQTYKIGFVYYSQGDYDAALKAFYEASQELKDNPNLLYALATTQYRRGQYAIAEGYYLYLLRLLGALKDQEAEFDLERNPEQRSLITNFYLTYNNLGCTFFKQVTARNEQKLTEAILYLQKAAEFYDLMTRDPQTLARLEEMTVTVRQGKKENIRGQGEEARFLKAPTPMYNLDVIMHNKAGKIYLGEYIDVVIYNLLPISLRSQSNLVVGGR